MQYLTYRVVINSNNSTQTKDPNEHLISSIQSIILTISLIINVIFHIFIKASIQLFHKNKYTISKFEIRSFLILEFIFFLPIFCHKFIKIPQLLTNTHSHLHKHTHAYSILVFKTDILYILKSDYGLLISFEE